MPLLQSQARALATHNFCRCDAHGEPGPECDWPDGFTRVDIFDRAPGELNGGYCVRNGPYPDP